MRLNGHMDALRQSFANQFSEDEHGILYRKYQKGPPFRVSRLERDGFVATYIKRMRYAIWCTALLTVGLILLLAWLIPNADSADKQVASWMGITMILLPVMAVHYWAWNAPTRALERRVPEGPALTKDQARVLGLSQITYGQLAIVPVVSAGLVWKMSMKTDVFHGSGRGWLVLGAAPVVLAAIQALRKWRYGRQ